MDSCFSPLQAKLIFGIFVCLGVIGMRAHIGGPNLVAGERLLSSKNLEEDISRRNNDHYPMTWFTRPWKLKWQTLFGVEKYVFYGRKTLEDEWKSDWRNYNHGSWSVDEGAVQINGSAVQCSGGHGYLYRPRYLEDEASKAGNFTDPWHRPWNPEDGRFLLPFCKKGGVSNRIRCFRGAMLLAGILNRTLIQPVYLPKIRMDMRPYYDLEHWRQCYGQNTVLSYDEYLQKYGSPLVVQHVLCVQNGHCPTNERSRVRAVNKTEWFEDARLSGDVKVWEFPILPHVKTAEFMVNSYGGIGPGVLYLHNQLFLKYFEGPYFKDAYVVDLPFQKRGKCSSSLAIQPPAALMRAAKEYIESIIGGEKFLALHLRLGDFKSYCVAKNSQCRFREDEIVKCLSRQLARSNLSFVFIATNGRSSEIKHIEILDAIVGNKTVHYFDFQTHRINKRARWAMHMVKQGFDISQPSVKIALEKTLCAYSLIFLGSPASSFSADIMRLRYGFGNANCADDFYCGPPKGPKPNGDNL